MRRHLICSLWLLLLTLTVAAVAQDEFSADIYNTQNGKDKDMAQQAKIYMAKDKLRIESHQQRGPGGVVIVNLQTQVNDVLMPERKMYMEMPQGQGFQRQAYPFFRTGDVANACADWEKLATNHGTTCKKIGSETVNGRNTIKYEGTRADGTVSDVWIDPSLRFPIKWKTNNGEGELRNISVGSQAASLFEVPSDYQKMQMPAGMPPNMQHP